MKRSSIYMPVFVLCLCACQATYQQYIPAPHEMPANANVFTNQVHTPKEQITVQSTQLVNLDLLQALMKTRGFLYKGYRTVQSEYNLSIPGIQEAACTIGASNAIYFITDKKTVREEKEKFDISSMLGGIIKSRKSDDYKNALSQGMNQTKYNEDVTYYTYMITYWSKTDDKTLMILNDNEVTVLKNEQMKLREKIHVMEKRMRLLEKQKRTIEYKTENKYITKNEYKTEGTTKYDEPILEINNKIAEINEELKSMHTLQREVVTAIDQNDTRQGIKPYRGMKR